MLLSSSAAVSPPAASTVSLLSGSSDTTRKANSQAALPQAPADAVAQVGTAANEDSVTLSASYDPNHPANNFGDIYAEIWKDGQKVALIDSHGGVTSVNGMFSAPGGGGNGPGAAALRAVQVAQSVGGEVRIAGEAVDTATLAMRARLRAVYGS